MGGYSAPRYYQPGQKIRGPLDPRMVPIGYKASKIGSEKEFVKKFMEFDPDSRKITVLNQKDFEEQSAADEVARQAFAPSPDEPVYRSRMSGFKPRNIKIFESYDNVYFSIY